MMIGCGMTVVSVFAAGVYFGSRFGNVTAGIFISFALNIAFIWSIIRETLHD